MVLLVAVIAAGGAWYGLVRDRGGVSGTALVGTRGEAEVSLVPAQADAAGADVGAGFVLTSSKPLKVSDVREQLKIEPAVLFQVEATGSSGKQFAVRPDKPLESGRIYRFRLEPAAGVSRAYQWAFQTKSAFRVLCTLPRDQASGVPLKTGIEITFSHEEYGDVAPLFSISPKVEGRFERHKRTVAFVPSQPLEAGTIYTVTLKKGLALKGTSDSLTQDLSFAFETQEESRSKATSWFSLPESLLEFAAADTPYFPVYAERNVTLAVSVYRYKDAPAYIAALSKVDQVPWWAQYGRSQFYEEPAGLTRVSSFSATAVEYPDYGSYLVFPEPLKPGYYLADVKLAESARQVRFQVTDLSAYVAVSQTQTLVWLNDLKSKGPVPGARVTLSGTGASANTDAGGVATLTTPPESTQPDKRAAVFLTARVGDREMVIPGVSGFDAYMYYRHRWGGWGEATGKVAQYWRYLYLDRALYKPDDKVNVWGVVLPREPGALTINSITAEVVRHDYRDYDYQTVVLAKAAIPVQDGTFTGAVELPGVKPGYYTLQVTMGEEVLQSRYFEVASYTKPSYVVDVLPAKKAIWAGESMEVKVRAAFFEGTPVPNLALSHNLGGKGTVVTDEMGEAVLTYTGSSQHVDSAGYPSWTSFNVYARGPEAAEISAYSTVQVFSRDVLLSPQVKVDGKAAVVSGVVNRVTLDGINSGQSHDYVGAPAPGTLVEGQLIEQNWRRIEDGQDYDFIQKQFTTRYRYEPAHRQVGTFRATTDAQGRFEHRLEVDPEKSYQIRLQARDSQGRWVTRDLWFWGKQYQQNQRSRWRWFGLAPDQPEKYRWGLKEEVAVSFREENVPVRDRSKAFLFYTARLGIQEWRVQDNGTFRYKLKEKDLPNTNLSGVYFDGRQYHEAYQYALRVDPAEKALKVTVAPDKTAYKPGESVTLRVHVQDRQGCPVRAQVNLNLVDEALYALRENEASLLEALYDDHVPTGVLTTRSSHKEPLPPSAAEKGGEGGGARKDFKDAIFFATTATDTSGNATATFKVPDNLTTWRVTYQAFAPSTKEAGGGTTGIAVKLPFFVEPVIGETYLAGDRPLIPIRSFGTGLQTGQKVAITTTVQGSVQATVGQEGVAFRATFGSFGQAPLKAGQYTVTVKATAGSLSDAVEKPVTVLDSYLRQQKVDFQLLAAGGKVTGAEKGLTTVVFSDYERGRYLRLLQNLRWQWGNRFEQKLTRSMAGELLQEYLGEAKIPEGSDPELDTYAYQAPDGGIAILPYADSDLYLSALAADAAADRFDRYSLESYFTKILEAKEEPGRDRRILALWGLAALDRPVLQTLTDLATLTDLTLSERFYVAMALAGLGDLEAARPIYRAIIAEHGEQLGSDARIKTGRDQDEILQRTAWAAALSAKLAEAETPAFVGYLLTNWGRDVLLCLEELMAVKDALPRVKTAPVTFTYVLDGKEQRVELKAGQQHTLALTPQSLAGLRIKEVQGKLGAMAVYEAPVAQIDLKQREGFTLKRSYANQSTGSAGQFVVGDLVKVTIDYAIPDTAPSGPYEVSDYLPSGLRLIERPWAQGVKWTAHNDPAWPLEVLGQRATFYAGKGQSSISYYARVMAPGEYTAEQPVLQHQRSGLIYAVGMREQVRIR